MDRFVACFGEVEDPRALNRRHDFLEVVFVALAAMLCGAEDCTDMAAFARAKLASLREVVALQHGPPSHDTFSRIFRLLAPEPFEAAFAKFTAAFAGALEGVVAIDGKALRGAYDRGRRVTPLHLINIWAAKARLVTASAWHRGATRCWAPSRRWRCCGLRAASSPPMRCTAAPTPRRRSWPPGPIMPLR